MKIIDVNSGNEVKVGGTFYNVNGYHQLLSVEEHFFSASAMFVSQLTARHAPELVNVPLQVRFTHPSFFGRKVAFIPS